MIYNAMFTECSDSNECTRTIPILFNTLQIPHVYEAATRATMVVRAVVERVIVIGFLIPFCIYIDVLINVLENIMLFKNFT